MGVLVAAILVIAVVACSMSCIYDSTEIPKMKGKPKHTIFED